jgi:feruloyl esterase
MRHRIAVVVLCAALLAGAPYGVAPAAAATCYSLAAVAFSHTTITAVQLVTSGAFDPPGPTPPVTNLPPFCRVSLTVDPQITIQVWLPITSDRTHSICSARS